MRKGALFFWAALWFCLVGLWPKQTNLSSPAIEAIANAGEGLFKSSLTRANLGLLGVEFYETSQGKKHWNMRSEFAELHRRENFALMQNVEAEFYAEATGNTIRTQSQWGRSRLDSELVELEGNVRIVSRKGYLFTMSRLFYSGRTHEFSTEEMVQMKGPSLENPSVFLRGTGLRGDIDREHFLLRKSVSAQKKLKGSEWLKVASRSGEFFTNEQRAVFVGRVRSFLRKIQINSDILEITLEPENESLFARGDVVLRHKERVGYADRAFLAVNSNKIVLEGKAKVETEDNQVMGRRITIYTDDDRIEVEQAQGRIREN